MWWYLIFREFFGWNKLSIFCECYKSCGRMRSRIRKYGVSGFGDRGILFVSVIGNV